jgi:hypothetical protein
VKENAEYEQMLSSGRMFISLGFSHLDKEVLVHIKTNTAVEMDQPHAERPAEK